MKQNKKLCIKTKKVIDRGKSKPPTEVKQVKYVSKNLQTFPESRPTQKAVIPWYKLGIQFWVKWLHNIYLTKAKSGTLSLFIENTQI